LGLNNFKTKNLENQDWLNYKIQVRNRLRSFSLKILELSEMFPKSERGRILNNQVTRSGTSTYANYRAALRGRSGREFFAKLSISVEEADETEMWLDLVIASATINSPFVKEMHSESLELLKILSSMRKRAGDRD
jgi:four helix bundle protein